MGRASTEMLWRLKKYDAHFMRSCRTDARSYIDALTNRDPPLLHPEENPPHDTAKSVRDAFEAQLLTRHVLGENRDKVVKIIGWERLESLMLNGDPVERLQLLEDINTSKQCLGLCNMASTQVSQHKIHIIGGVVAGGDSDQVVVTTLTDLLDVKKATFADGSAKLIGS